MRLFSWIILLALCFVASISAYAQGAAEPLINGNFDKTDFENFAKEIEAKTPYRFYFDPATVDSVVVTAQVQARPLAEVLDLALKATNLRYAIDSEKRVYITAGSPLATELPPGYFSQEPADNIAVTDTQSAEDNASSKKSVWAATLQMRVYEIGKGSSEAKGSATLAGYVRDIKSGEPIIGASVFIESPSIGVATDQFGYYSLTLPVGRHELKIRGVGVKNTKRQIVLRADGKLDIEVEEDITTLREVVVEAEKDKNVAGMQMGLERLDIKTMRQVPTAFGETDILRIVLTLPGVKSVGEGSTGLNVRGGSTDQNLILFNDATVYNPSHLFGFFSAFNPDILKTVELYKGTIPAKYGGRLSSVLDITTRDGNKKQFAGSGGIGLLTSRLAFEGPIVKDKSAFLLSGRTSYSNWILKRLSNSKLKQSSASFYDLNAHISHEINDKNSLYLTGYRSRDEFQLASDSVYQYENTTASLKWRHNFNNRLSGVLTSAYSQYQYNISSLDNPVTDARLRYNIRQINTQVDFSYLPSAKHTIDFGASSILYNVLPGSVIGRPVL